MRVKIMMVEDQRIRYRVPYLSNIIFHPTKLKLVLPLESKFRLPGYFETFFAIISTLLDCPFYVASCDIEM